jgi:Mrp family chromosome partitioning ATPase
MEERRLSLSMPIGGGPRKVVEVPSKDILSTLIFANEQLLTGAAGYHAVAENLLHENWWNPRRVFVTSPVRGDGKTCTAFNLAWALTTRGKSVLLVELNFARPRFRSVLGDLRIRYGVDCAIRGSVKPADSVFSMGSDRLNVSAVRDAMGRRELKQNMPSLVSFLNWGSENYDWLILDCPSVLSPSWNTWFRENAEPALLVVREHQTPLVQIRQATRNLGDRLKGVLLNDSGMLQPSAQAAEGGVSAA